MTGGDAGVRPGAAAAWRGAAVVGLLSLLGTAWPAQAAVPAPSEMGVDIIVSGRTSTARDVQVVRAGDEIPRTFSGDRVRNTKGFTWWVSRHFALKTDYPEEQARFYLALLETAYPHYVELFGREPPGIAEKRMAVCYASSLERLRDALKSDGLRWNFDGGGITFENYFCAYVYPSGTLHYHQRYILLHECTHLYQMCLNGSTYTTPAWHYEGVADALATHVYDTARRRLTVLVFDKPTTHDYFDEGRIDLGRKPVTAVQIHDQGTASRGIAFLLVHFFMDDPDRLQKFRLWRDEMFRLNLQKNTAESGRLIRQLFGPWDQVNAAFAAWTASLRNTFHYAEWGWEQDADALWSYGFAENGRLSETDVYLPPGETPVYSPLRMDYPLQERSPLVGHVERGTAEPSVGCLIDFSHNPGKGRAGIGLGLVSALTAPPIPAAALFADEAATKPGIKATAWRLDKVAGEGKQPGDVKNGPRLGESVDPAIGLELPRSITQGLKNDFAVEWDGWIRIAKDDLYTFVTTSDDGSWLWVDGKEVVSNGGRHLTRTASGTVKLAAGVHRLRVRYFQGDGPRVLDVGLMAGARPGCLKLLVDAGSSLVLDGTDLGIEKKAVRIPKDVQAAMAAGGHRVGLTARIAKAAVEVTLRAKDPNASDVRELRASLSLTEDPRRRLLTHPLAVLSRDGWHGVTPCFDDRRRPEPDLSAPAPPNRWRNSGDRQLAALYRAAWHLGEKTPPSLAALKASMLAAADKDAAAQKEALTAFAKAVDAVLNDMERCGARPETIARAAQELRGASSPEAK